MRTWRHGKRQNGHRLEPLGALQYEYDITDVNCNLLVYDRLQIPFRHTPRAWPCLLDRSGLWLD